HAPRQVNILTRSPRRPARVACPARQGERVDGFEVKHELEFAQRRFVRANSVAGTPTPNDRKHRTPDAARVCLSAGLNRLIIPLRLRLAGKSEKFQGVRGCHVRTVNLRSRAARCWWAEQHSAYCRRGVHFRRRRSRSRLDSSPSIPARWPPAASNRWRVRLFISRNAAA